MSFVTQEAREYAQSIIDTVREALIVLDEDLRVVSAGRSFYRRFELSPKEAEGRLIYDLDNGRWNIPDLRRLLETVTSEQTTVEDFQVRHRFETLGEKIMTLNARPVMREGGKAGLILLAIEDLTEARQSEEKMQRFQKSLQDTIDSITDGFLLLDKDWFIEELSTTGARILGMTRKELLGNNFWEVFTYARETKFYEMYHKAVDKKEAQHFEEYYPEPLNRWLESHCYPREEGLTVFFRDVTDRKQSEDALRNSEEKFRAVFEQAAIGIGRVGFDDARWIDVNNAFCEMLGYSVEEFRATPWPEITHPDDIEIDLIPFKQMAAGELDSYSVEKRFIHKAGHQFWARLTLSLVRDEKGRPDYEIAIIEDINERKNAELALKKSEERLQQTFRIESVGVLFFDMASNFTDANDAFLRMIGFDRQALESGELRSDRVTLPEWMPRTRQAFEELQAAGRFRPYEKQLVRPDGTRWWGLFAGTRLGENEAVEFVIDITELKKIEQALRHRTEELAAANGDLESFTFSVSHDLRNPLQAIGSFAAILKEDYMDRLDEDGKDFVRRIDEGVKKMKRLIDDMLSLSRIGKLEMKRQDVNLSDMVCDYLEELKRMEPWRRIECVVEDNVHACADPRLIHPALENLLSNAWKFTSRKDNGRIEFGSFHEDSRTIYFIRDNGAGFDTLFAQKIFEPFKRGHAEQEFGGTGVGLSIVQRVISRHGGEVWAEGDVGKGAAFYFTLGDSSALSPMP